MSGQDQGPPQIERHGEGLYRKCKESGVSPVRGLGDRTGFVLGETCREGSLFLPTNKAGKRKKWIEAYMGGGRSPD